MNVIFSYLPPWVGAVLLFASAIGLAAIVGTHRHVLSVQLRWGYALWAGGNALAGVHLIGPDFIVYALMLACYLVAAVLILRYGYRHGSAETKQKMTANLALLGLCVAILAMLVVAKLLSK